MVVGDDLTLVVEVANDGDGPVSGAHLEVTLPEGLGFSSSTPSATSSTPGPDGTVLGFALSDLGPHSATEVIIEVVAMAPTGPGGAVARAVLSVPEMQEQSAEAAIVIAPESPLLLRMMPVPLLTEVGGRITYRMTVENVSQNPVDDVSVVNLVPAEVHVLYVDCPCSGNGLCLHVNTGQEGFSAWARSYSGNCPPIVDRVASSTQLCSVL